ncbi:MAG: class I SAM-dependent methyltransferase, partial [Candidatus Binatia bacterium]
LALHTSNIRVSGETPEFFADYKVRDIAHAFAAEACRVKHPTILDFGGGVGTSVPYFERYFPGARLVCLDVSRKSLAFARRRSSASVSLVQFDGKRVPFADYSFDIGFAACVFHHIEPADRPRLLAELNRVLKPGGRLFVFEHNPLNPLTVHAVNACPFDENAKLISGKRMKQQIAEARFDEVALRFRIFFPRALAKLRPVERFMTAIPLGAQYYVVGRKA